ncbi:MAG: TetR family transcriptional regulator C-terminal domain-containing protein, partial [Oceanococcaceae bacterium]
LAGRSVSAQLRQRVEQAGALGGLAAFIEGWKQTLEQSDFEAGCPILAVAAEQYVAEDGYPNAEVQDQLLQRTAAAFAEWQSILMEALQKEGIAADQARPLATVIISAVEGAVTMCRASKSTAALSEVEWVLSGLLRTALPSTPA